MGKKVTVSHPGHFQIAVGAFSPGSTIEIDVPSDCYWVPDHKQPGWFYVRRRRWWSRVVDRILDLTPLHIIAALSFAYWTLRSLLG